MFRQALFPRSLHHADLRSIPRIRNPRLQPFIRRYATEPTTSTPTSAHTRLARINRRLPRFLHKYTNALGTAPVTHVVSFILLHELTAIVPLFALAATFHYTHYLPPYFAEGTWVIAGVEMFGKYFRRKGWIRSDEAAQAELEAQENVKSDGTLRRRDKAWNISEGGVRVVVEFATAYAITKVLLPVRLVLSVWATPWFARWTVIPMQNAVKRVFRRGRGR
jgi:hypothetical protein